MKVSVLREKFLAYFERHGHTRVPSSSTVPLNDPTLLFTNAGMVQFKEVLLGKEKRDYQRATSSQRCIRAGGKHNDLENVGYTARHHTFFEMLGNFSFGDYFKREAILYAWEFLTLELKLPAEKLWITVYEKDDEAANIWLNEIGVDEARFSRCGDKDNFWSMGDTGPCGPCSEIFYDHGPDVPGGPPGSPEQEGDRYIEIWNLVFMQYERAANGELSPLPMTAVDTGMGLERISAVLQNVHNNYDIDVFQQLIAAAAHLLNRPVSGHQSLKVIADHIRACCFLMADGVMPSNEGRGYVLRRIMRRALRHGHLLGAKKHFFHQMVAPLIAAMGDVYPRLVEQQSLLEKMILKEEEQFSKTLTAGLAVLEAAISEMNSTVIDGNTVFKLYDTYGFPVDLTADIARERNLTIDQSGFEHCMAEQRARARAASQFSTDYTQTLKIDETSEFVGYEHLKEQSTVTDLYQEAQQTRVLTAGQSGGVLLASTPFYAESGGQVGDTGELITTAARFRVDDTQKVNEAIVHYGQVIEGTLRQGDAITAQVDGVRRQSIALNHSATHLLHAALREILGGHVVQKGSLVNAERLRFDFSHYSALTPETLHTIEDLVNEKIRADLAAHVEVTDPETAQQRGAMALFGEKYGDTVRLLSMGTFSVELCGGTHVQRTGEIGWFKIIAETGIASGVRRIEAITGQAAINYVREDDGRLKDVSHLLKTDKAQLFDKINDLLSRVKSLEKEKAGLKQSLAQASQGDWQSQVESVGTTKVLALAVPDADAKLLRTMVDDVKSRFPSIIVVLASTSENSVSLVAGVSKDISQTVPAKELVNFVASQVGGKGGGRAELAQAGGTQPEKLSHALSTVKAWAAERL